MNMLGTCVVRNLVALCWLYTAMYACPRIAIAHSIYTCNSWRACGGGDWHIHGAVGGKAEVHMCVYLVNLLLWLYNKGS